MRFYIIAGERSGDLHGSNLVRHLAANDELAEFRGIGGKRMQKENVVLARHSSEMSFMGFWEVVRHLRKIYRAFRFVYRDIKQYRPDALILIDFPGFNLRVAKWAAKHGFRVIYYITPQVWAWKADRVYKLDAHSDKMITILPFEPQFFRDYGIEVDNVSHPIVEEIASEKEIDPDPKTAAISEKPVIALLPGSRKQEVKHILPIMSEVAKYYPDHQFVVAGVSEIPRDFYERFISTDWVKIVYDKTYDLLKIADAALVTSGTATLETALFGVPQVVCYKGNRFSYWMARRMVDVPYISLVNLVLNQELVTELIQDELTATNLKDELGRLLSGKKRQCVIDGYTEMQQLLGEGSGSAQAAEIIKDYLKE